jgi:predicted nuclease of predicted toxin-antitoxin system
MVRFFADECIPFDIIMALRQQDLTMTGVRDVGLVGASDEEIFVYCQKHNLVILTFDRGYGDIFRFPIRKSFGVIIVRNSQFTPNEVIGVVLNFSERVMVGELKGKLAIIGKSRIRITQP